MNLFYEPPTNELLAPYWEAFERRRIVLPRCSGCKSFQWYPDAAGPDCPNATYEWVDVALTGTVYSVTRVHRAFLPAAADALPFGVGMIELDGAEGVRMVANLDDDAGIAIGDRVEAKFEKSDGRWRPIFHAAGHA
jgi:uncharacterized protein